MTNTFAAAEVPRNVQEYYDLQDRAIAEFGLAGLLAVTTGERTAELDLTSEEFGQIAYIEQVVGEAAARSWMDAIVQTKLGRYHSDARS